MAAESSAACPNCGAPVAEGRCSSVTCQNHNGPSAATTGLPTQAQLVRACQLYRQKLDRLHADYERLAEWASSNAEDDLFAGQVAMYARARLAEWELPLERWEP